jgi:hypothetical protein
MTAFNASNPDGSPIVASTPPRPSSRGHRRHSHHHHHQSVAAAPPAEENHGTFYVGTPEQLRAIDAKIKESAALHPLVEFGSAPPKQETVVGQAKHAKGTLIGEPIRVGPSPVPGEASPSTATFYKAENSTPSKPVMRKLLKPGL